MRPNTLSITDILQAISTGKTTAEFAGTTRNSIASIDYGALHLQALGLGLSTVLPYNQPNFSL